MMSIFIHMDNLFWTLHQSPSAGGTGVPLKPILYLNPNHSWFCFIFCNLLHCSLFWISTQFIPCKEIFKCGYSEGKERVKRGEPILTLSLVSLWSLFATNKYIQNSVGSLLENYYNFKSFSVHPEGSVNNPIFWA